MSGKHEELVKSLRELQEVYAECDYSCGECLNRRECDKYDNDALSKTFKQFGDALEELQAEIERLKNERRWIPVTERLPKSFDEVIVCRSGTRVMPGRLDVNGWWKVFGTRTKNVTHWMPLPEPPEEE